MKILYITVPHPDYLSDALLHGLKSITELEIIEYPKNKFIYKGPDPTQKLYGKGFTLYNLLDDQLCQHLPAGYTDFKNIDYFIFSGINYQIDAFRHLGKWLNFKNTIILDGSDGEEFFPFSGYYFRRPAFWFLPHVHKKYLYFKREWTPNTARYRFWKLISTNLANRFWEKTNFRPVSFGIPSEKIIDSLPVKNKLFPRHIVDIEVVKRVEGSTASYAFDNEIDYYLDLQSSQYGITTKRAGWDCMRHYEIAANGGVICFRNLIKKPDSCAPHGLIPNINCISYSNFDDLQDQTCRIDDNKYVRLQKGCLEWVKNYTTEKVAWRILAQMNS